MYWSEVYLELWRIACCITYSSNSEQDIKAIMYFKKDASLKDTPLRLNSKVFSVTLSMEKCLLELFYFSTNESSMSNEKDFQI